MSAPWLIAVFGQSGSQFPQLIQVSVMIIAMVATPLAVRKLPETGFDSHDAGAPRTRGA
jgi:hypothetical protein